MFYKKINLISPRDKLKKENKKKLNRKFIEDESSLFIEKNKTPKLRQEVQSYEEFIKHMGKYLKLEESNKKTYYNKFKKNIEDDKNEINKKKQRIQYDNNFNNYNTFNNKLRILEENKSFANFNKLKHNYFSFLFEDKIKVNESSNTTNTRYKKINIRTFNNFNANSHNTLKINKNYKLLESINSLKLNIIRKRIHLNKINNLKDTPRALLKLKLQNVLQKNSSKNNLNNNNINTNNLNLNSFETNSLNSLEQNCTNYRRMPIIKESKELKLFGKKLKWENKLKIKKPFSLNKILEKYNRKKNFNEKIKSISRKKIEEYKNNLTISTDRQSDNIIKPIRLKNFEEWK